MGKRENENCLPAFPLLPTMFPPVFPFPLGYSNWGNLTLSQTINFRFFQVQREEFADNNFKCDENGRKFSKWSENTVGKREIARHKQFLLFPQCFHKTYTADT